MVKGCGYFSTLFILFGCGLYFMVSGINFMGQENINEKNCYITNVTYPTSVYDSANLIECHCGRRCKSDTGTCIRVYGRLVGENKASLLFDSTDTSGNNRGCTFAETKCKNGEKITDRTQSLEKAKDIALEYIKLIDSEEAVTCYQKTNQDQIYLYKEDYTTHLIVSGSLFGFFALIFLCCCCECEYKKGKDSTRNNFI